MKDLDEILQRYQMSSVRWNRSPVSPSPEVQPVCTVMLKRGPGDVGFGTATEIEKAVTLAQLDLGAPKGLPLVVGNA